MNRSVFVIIVYSSLAWACTKKALPVISERKTMTSPPVKKEISVQPDVAMGKTIFINRCGRCHDLPKPGQYTAQRWDGILSYMIPRARLTDEQGIHVSAYLRANAAK